MRLHRFYVIPEEVELKNSIWVKDQGLRNQWIKVLRYREGDEVVLFDGVETERLYKIIQIAPDAIHVEMVTEFERKLPKKHVYLFWSLLKKDKNDWVIQKCTELGVSNFVPIIAERSEKTGFSLERAEKIAIEASEQCGRGDIPRFREPLSVEEAIDEYKDKVVMMICDETVDDNQRLNDEKPIGIFIGPEGGWTENELTLMKEAGFGSLHLGSMTLRAETACVVASSKLLQ